MQPGAAHDRIWAPEGPRPARLSGLGIVKRAKNAQDHASQLKQNGDGPRGRGVGERPRGFRFANGWGCADLQDFLRLIFLHLIQKETNLA